MSWSHCPEKNLCFPSLLSSGFPSQVVLELLLTHTSSGLLISGFLDAKSLHNTSGITWLHLFGLNNQKIRAMCACGQVYSGYKIILLKMQHVPYRIQRTAILLSDRWFMNSLSQLLLNRKFFLSDRWLYKICWLSTDNVALSWERS